MLYFCFNVDWNVILKGTVNNNPTLIKTIGITMMTRNDLNQWWSSLLRHIGVTRVRWVNTLRPRQNGRHFADDTFKHIFLNENVGISTKILLKFVPKGQINNIPALVQIMAWRRPGDKPLSEPRVESLLTHICVTRPQWVKITRHIRCNLAY